MKMRITNNHDTASYYGHGKLLLTGEYFVLDGATALAVPTRYGQTLRVRELHSSESVLYWVALNNQGSPWLNLAFDTTDFRCINSAQDEATRLSKMLNEARRLNPSFLSNGRDIAIETRLEFPREWGLGSSSTLIHCLSKWAGVDGYKLLKATIGGSGYDVACAGVNTPLLYRLQHGRPEILPTHWAPPFKQNIWFAYSGKKQLSSEGISYYKNKLQDKTHAIEQLSRITNMMLQTTALNDFEELLREHEQIVGSQLKLMKVSDTIFADYWGVSKSLGAWGGDFIMLTNQRPVDELTGYLKEKNISIAFNWNDLILSET
jgi:mevalonate kinase